MSTSLAGGCPGGPLPEIALSSRVAVVATMWNAKIVDPLTQGATEVLSANDVAFDVYHVPGAVELTFAARRLADTGRYKAVIILGCVIRGGTPHFDYVCQSVTQGMTAINAEGRVPVIFGVLTVDTEQDAFDRAGGCLGNKGAEAAEAAIHMISLAEGLPC